MTTDAQQNMGWQPTKMAPLLPHTNPKGGIGQQGTTTWELSEFDAHMKRLVRVSDAVAETKNKAQEARDDTGDAYGLLFGWIVAPMVNKCADSAMNFSDQLSKSLSISQEAIKSTRNSYSNTDSNNASASRAVEIDLDRAAMKGAN